MDHEQHALMGLGLREGAEALRKAADRFQTIHDQTHDFFMRGIPPSVRKTELQEWADEARRAANEMSSE